MSIFEVMGPVMIGPSSSHTAGAVKIGRISSLIFADKIEKAEIAFHGSFAETYLGHGTDKAVVGGILGFNPDDERIRDSLKIAHKRKISINFKKVNLRNVHPNTVIISLKNGDKELSLRGSSIGGGNILIWQIDKYEVNISGKLPTLWLVHLDTPGKVGDITSVLGKYHLNIAFMKVFRKKKGTIGSSVIELDDKVNNDVLDHLKHLKDIIKVRYIPPF